MDDTPPYRPTVHTQADLEAVWLHLMASGGFGGRSLWMLRIDADRQVVPHVVEIAECDQPPEPDRVEGLARLLGALDADAAGGSWAFLVSRPGRGVHDSDRTWAWLVHEAGAAAGVRLEMTHLATGEGITPLPPDELTARTA